MVSAVIIVGGGAAVEKMRAHRRALDDIVAFIFSIAFFFSLTTRISSLSGS